MHKVTIKARTNNTLIVTATVVSVTHLKQHDS